MENDKPDSPVPRIDIGSLGYYVWCSGCDEEITTTSSESEAHRKKTEHEFEHARGDFD